jgi:glycosyltransferase involved in cell wall biosynthesis
MRLRQLKRLAGITLISQATLRQFESDWPDVAIPRRVISNGFNFSSWRPATKRQKTVIVVGRAHEAKGILETAKGVSVFLEKFRDWRAVFVLSAPKQSKEYFDSVVDALRPFKSQIDVMTDIPFAQVKQITENAAISVVASKWEEPFGRTALEAHAGGAALISSQTGGLREISGDAASYLDEVTSSTIASALLRLASDDALREKMSHEGMQRVRRLFSLARNSNEVAGEVIPICERLDQFYREVLENHNRSARESKCDYRGAI